MARLGVASTLTRPELVGPLGRAAAAAGRTLAVHVKVDTGMHRLGPPAAVAESLVAAVRAEPGLRLEGFYTHFPNADSPDADDTGPDDTQRRFARFLPLAERAGAPLRHAANSATLLRYPGMSLDLVRVGAGVYGFGPGRRPGSRPSCCGPSRRGGRGWCKSRMSRPARRSRTGARGRPRGRRAWALSRWATPMASGARCRIGA